MSITIYLPAYLQPFAGGRSELELAMDVGPRTVAGALAELRERYPGVYDRIVTERGEVREHVNVFVGDERIRDGAGLASPVTDGSELLILPAVSGG